jgi:hypothetical protein
MKVIPVSDLGRYANSQLGHWIYNGADCCLTRALRDILAAELAASPCGLIYTFTMLQHGPALRMLLEGLRVDAATRAQLTVLNKRQEADARQAIEAAAGALGSADVWGEPKRKDGPPGELSNVKLMKLLYEQCGFKAVMKFDKKTGRRRPTVDKTALDTLHNRHTELHPLVAGIRSLRKAQKRLEVLEKPIDGDGRFRCFFKVASGRDSDDVDNDA